LTRPAPPSPKPLRAILKLGYACNNRCSFCHASEHQDRIPLTTEAILRRVRAVRRQGVEELLFSGGEATIRDDLPRLAREAAVQGMTVGLVTNGRRLAYAPLVERLVALGLRYAYVSFHGADAATHDRIVGVPGAHAQALAGIHNLLAHPVIDLTVNIVVVTDTLRHLLGVPEALAAERAYQLKYSWVEPKGRAAEGFDRVVPRLAAAAPRVIEAMDAAAPRLPPGSPPPAHDGFPWCVMGALAERVDGLSTQNIRYMAEVFEDRLFPCDAGQRVHAPACEVCRLKARCPGLYAGYLERVGDAELRPLA
jgi:MoaA/NifB/PqqE/SkfB family radical SAM enzyme